jgi:hypothetical protein
LGRTVKTTALRWGPIPRPLSRGGFRALGRSLTDWQRWERPLELGNVIAGVVAALLLVTAAGGFGSDARAYWSVDPLHPYPTRDYGASGAFFYSPVIALIAAPLSVIPWPVFLGLIFLVSIAALRWLVGRWVGYALLLPPVMNELLGGNIDLLLTVAIVAGFRRPALWAPVLLTKVTPGIGLLWFAARREWRALAIVAGVTLPLVAVSFVIAPSAWREWVEILTDNAGRPPGPLAFPIPLLLRLPLAALLVVMAARTNRPWLVPIAAFLSIAVIWRPHYVFLLGAPAVWRRSEAWRGRWRAYVGRGQAGSEQRELEHQDLEPRELERLEPA